MGRTQADAAAAKIYRMPERQLNVVSSKLTIVNCDDLGATTLETVDAAETVSNSRRCTMSSSLSVGWGEYDHDKNPVQEHEY